MAVVVVEVGIRKEMVVGVMIRGVKLGIRLGITLGIMMGCAVRIEMEV